MVQLLFLATNPNGLVLGSSMALIPTETIHDFLDGKPTHTNHNVIVSGDHAITLSIISRYHSHTSNTYLKRVQQKGLLIITSPLCGITQCTQHLE